jgi:hypothetical protein
VIGFCWFGGLTKELFAGREGEWLHFIREDVSA